jgi:hypothetical protein
MQELSDTKYFSIMQVYPFQLASRCGLKSDLNVKRLGEGGTQTFDRGILPQSFEDCKGDISNTL